MARNWTDNSAGWVEHEAVFDAVFTPVTAAVLAAADLKAGERVLDVGCGSGTLLAAADAAGAQPVGVDISPLMVAAAARRVPSAVVRAEDAETADLGSLAPGTPFDVVVSRFGVMFFEDPVAAFANLRSATHDGSRLAFACWRSAEENQMFTLGLEILTRGLDEPPEPPEPDQPGPTAFADPDRLRDVLAGAGWSSITTERLDVELDYGTDGTDGVENRIATILSMSSGRSARAELEPRLGASGWAELMEEVRTELRGHQVDGRLRIPGAIWIARATNEQEPST